MILKIYLIISILTFIIYQLKVIKFVLKYMDKLETLKLGSSGIKKGNIIKSIIKCFFPILNIILLIYYLFILNDDLIWKEIYEITRSIDESIDSNNINK